MVSHDQSSSSPSTDIMMMSSKVTVATQSKGYTSKSPVENEDDSSSLGQTSTSILPSSKPLHIEKSNLDMIIRPPPKGMLRKSPFNPHARAPKNYNIVKYLVMSPSDMSALEVLQTCPT